MKSTFTKLFIGIFAFSLVFTSCFKDDLLREIDDLRTLVVTLQQKNDSLNKVINLRADSLAKALTASQKRSDSLAVVLRTKTDSLSQALGITNTNLLNMGKSIDSIKSQLTGINTQLTQLSSQLAATNSQIAALTLQLASANADIVALNTKYQQLTTQLQTINAQIAALQADQLKLLEKLNAILLILNPPVDITTGLVAYYPFSGNAGDSSGNGNHLITQGFPTFISSIINGKSKVVINFPTGNDYFLTPNSFNSLINNFPKGTVSFWIKLNIHYISNHYFGIDNSFFIKQKHSVGEDMFFGIMAGSTKIRMQVSGVFPSPPNTDVIGNTNLDIGVWYHVTGTWDGQFHKLYLNGKIDGQITNSIGISDRPIPDYTSLGSILYGGANDQGPSTALPSGAYGCMSDFRIYNRALTQSEITYLATH